MKTNAIPDDLKEKLNDHVPSVNDAQLIKISKIKGVLKVVISGIKGSGKTQLAVFFAVHCFPKISSKENFVIGYIGKDKDQSLSELSERLGLPSAPVPNLKRIEERLNEYHHCLLIYDNLDNEPEVEFKLRNGLIIYVTQNNLFAPQLSRINLNRGLDEWSARQLMIKTSKLMYKQEDATHLINLVGRLPGDIIRIANYIKRNNEERGGLHKPLLNYRDITLLIRENYNRAREFISSELIDCSNILENYKKETDQRLLIILAFFAADSIPKTKILRDIFTHLNDNQDDLEEVFNTSISNLRHYSLIYPNNDASDEQYFSHKKILYKIKNTFKVNQIVTQVAKSIAMVFNELFLPDPVKRNIDMLKMRQQHMRSIVSFLRNTIYLNIFTDEIVLLFSYVAWFYVQIGDSESAIKFIQRALYILKQYPDLDQKIKLETYRALAMIYVRMGDPVLAMEAERFLKKYLNQEGVNKLGLLHFLTITARVFDVHKAHEYAKEAYFLHLETQKDRIPIITYYAATLMDRGEVDLAIDFLEKLVSDKTIDQTNMGIATSYYFLGKAYELKRNFSKAIICLQKSESTRKNGLNKMSWSEAVIDLGKLEYYTNQFSSDFLSKVMQAAAYIIRIHGKGSRRYGYLMEQKWLGELWKTVKNSNIPTNKQLNSSANERTILSESVFSGRAKIVNMQMVQINNILDFNQEYTYEASYNPVSKILRFKIFFPIAANETCCIHLIRSFKVVHGTDFAHVDWDVNKSIASFSIDLSVEKVSVVSLFISDIHFLSINIEGSDLFLRQIFFLSVSDIRKLSLAEPYFHRRIRKLSHSLLTDLHTHFDAILTPEELINIAIKYDDGSIHFPIDKLIQYGILKKVDAQDKKVYTLKELDKEKLQQLLYKLKIPSDRQIVFYNLEVIYDLRDYLSGNIILFKYILNAIATKYEKQGIKYAEISFNNILDINWLTIAHECLPEIEERTKVKLRFLSAIYNYSAKEKILSDIENLKVLYKSPYIVGVDFAGHENCSIDAISNYIEMVAKWISENDKDFILRVHAGETKQHEPNVKKVLLIAKKYKIRVRIGHAIYNIDEETLEYARSLGENNLLIIEINPDSNIALNNICSESTLPVINFMENKIPFVLGTDGEGVYGTTQTQLLESFVSSIENDDLAKNTTKFIHEVEEGYISFQDRVFKRKFASPLALKTMAMQCQLYETNSLSLFSNHNIPKDRIPILIVSNYLNDEDEIDGKISKINLRYIISTFINNIDLNSVCFILTGFGKVSHSICRQFILHPDGYNDSPIVFFTAFDEDTLSTLSENNSQILNLNPICISDTRTSYSLAMINLIRERFGLILYVEDDFIGREISLLANAYSVPLLAVSNHILSEDNKNIHSEKVVDNACQVYKAINQHLIFTKKIPEKFAHLRYSLTQSKKYCNIYFGASNPFLRISTGSLLNWMQKEYDRRQCKDQKNKNNKNNPDNELVKYVPGAN